MNRNSKKNISEIAEMNSEEIKSSEIGSSNINGDKKKPHKRKSKCKVEF